MTVGVLVAFIAALNNFFDPIQQLSQLYTTYQAGMAALDKIFELLDEEPDLRDRPGRARAAAAARRAARSITSRSPTRRTRENAARGHRPRSCPPGRRSRSSARPARASRPSPSSRRASTTRREGTIRVDGHDLRDVQARSLRAQLGIVPQEAFLFCGTILDNLAFGRPDATLDEVEDAARAVGAHDFIAALEHGYETEVGERGIQLSAGQRQLVAFTRALIADPRILVLDEATSNVDIHTETRIEEGLRRLLAGRTAVVIAHRLSTIRGAGRIVVLEHGRIRRAGHARRAARGRGRVLAPVPRLGRAGRGLRAARRGARADPARPGCASARKFAITMKNVDSRTSAWTRSTSRLTSARSM